jgi:hypothetical protein
MENPQPMGGNGKRPAYGHGETKREWRVTFTMWGSDYIIETL